MNETFEEFQRRRHCGHVSPDETERELYEALVEIRRRDQLIQHVRNVYHNGGNSVQEMLLAFARYENTRASDNQCEHEGIIVGGQCTDCDEMVPESRPAADNHGRFAWERCPCCGESVESKLQENSIRSFFDILNGLESADATRHGDDDG